MDRLNGTASCGKRKDYGCGDAPLYVTLKSARNAAAKIVDIALSKSDRELREKRKKIIDDIIREYLPYTIPLNDELHKLRLTDTITLRDGEGNDCLYYTLSLYGYHDDIKEPYGCVHIPAAPILALMELDRESFDLKQRAEEMENRIFADIVLIGRKSRIEQEFPEIMPYLEFAPHTFDIDFCRHLLREGKKD